MSVELNDIRASIAAEVCRVGIHVQKKITDVLVYSCPHYIHREFRNFIKIVYFLNSNLSQNDINIITRATRRATAHNALHKTKYDKNLNLLVYTIDMTQSMRLQTNTLYDETRRIK